jgi:hypothetical protein
MPAASRKAVDYRRQWRGLSIGGLLGLTISGVSGNVGNGGSILNSAGGNLTAGSISLLLNYNNRTVSITNGPISISPSAMT